MGKLIYADDLKKEIDVYKQSLTYHDCLDEIERAPAIDAIPVEWIKECAYIAKLCGDEKFEYQLKVLLDCWKAEWNDSYTEAEDHIHFTFPEKGERIL